MTETPSPNDRLARIERRLAIAEAQLRKTGAEIDNLKDYGLKLGERVLRLELQLSVLTDRPLAEVVGA